MTHAAASAVYPARRLHCCAHRLFPRPLPASSVARPYVAALSSRRRGVPLLHSSRRFASTSSPPSTTSAPPPPPRPPSPPSPHVPHPLSYSRGADLTSAELDAVLRSSRRSPSSSSASSAAAEESELSALQSELAAEVAFDRRMASETVAQRIVRRLRRRQLGWKLLALLLAMAAMAASLQLLTLKQRSRAEGDAAEVLLTRLREEAQLREAEAAALTRLLVQRLSAIREGLTVQQGPRGGEAEWVEAFQRRVEEIQREGADCTVEEAALRQRISDLERRLAAQSRAP